jgi:methionyl-tRNA formyltransferase
MTELAPSARLSVFSFREEPHEPPFLDSIRDLTQSVGGHFLETRKLDGPRGLAYWEKPDVDLLLVVGWRYLIRDTVYLRPRRGTYVIHDSLLPRYRGFSPTVWAICNGEDHTGATLFAIADDVDSGDILDQQRVDIGPDETIAEVMERVTLAYLGLLERNLQAMLSGCARCQPQDVSQATYVRKRCDEDNQIHWDWPTRRIYNLTRAVTRPYQGAYMQVGEQRLRVWSARPLDGGKRSAAAGEVLELRPGEGAVIQTGDGALLLQTVQWPGQPPACAAEALAHLGRRLAA